MPLSLHAAGIEAAGSLGIPKMKRMGYGTATVVLAGMSEAWFELQILLIRFFRCVKVRGPCRSQ